MNDIFDIFCDSPLKCFLIIFGGSYMLWWLVLDGPTKWDRYFQDKMHKKTDVPIFLNDPLGLDEFNKK